VKSYLLKATLQKELQQLLLQSLVAILGGSAVLMFCCFVV